MRNSPGRLWRFGLAFLSALLMLPAGTGRSAEALRHPAAFQLSNGVLTLEVMSPGAAGCYNTGTRFTPVAAVLRAQCGGHEFLYNPLPHNPVTDHAGLAAEFDLCTPGGPAEDFPPGYQQAAIGEGFMKIGVGVLQKQQAPYSLFQNCKVLSLAQTRVEHDASRASYLQTCAGLNGYSYELRAELALDHNQLAIRWTLTNTGTRPFTTRHYSHNFIRFDEWDVGPGYELKFPYSVAPSGLTAQQALREDAVLFQARIPKWVNLRQAYPANYTGENTCTLLRPDSGMSLRLTTSLPGLYTAVHARPDYVSPEQFVLISLQPGEERIWLRSYLFSPPGGPE